MRFKIHLSAILLLAASPAAAQPSPTLASLPRSGSSSFSNWSFQWNVGSKNEGLELHNVRYKNVKVLHKASMPVVKVKYRGNAQNVDSGCGPYQDRLNWGNLITVSGASSRVVSRQWSNHMEIAVYSKIGGYHLYQAWYFHTDGRLQPMLYSRGWSCSHNPKSHRDHRHHPYWRLDFDIETHSGNVIHEFRRPQGAATHTATLYTVERDASRNAGEDLFWTVGRSGSQRHVVVRYTTNELRDATGSPWFAYTNKDMGARLYRGSEDNGWTFGAKGHLGFRSPQEPINGADVVFWSAGHMSHIWSQSDHNNPQWHASGPVIRAMW